MTPRPNFPLSAPLGQQRPIETTILRGRNITIGHANLNLTNHVNERNIASAEREHALDLLGANCAVTALVDANVRFDPPRCVEETRRKIIHEIEDWASNNNHSEPWQSSIFWLYGGAGAGKSALAQTLAERFKENGGLAASFFFFGADPKRNDGNRLIPTLALQLLDSFHGITPFMQEKIISNPVLFEKNRQTQMITLLLEPLKKLFLEEADRAGSDILSKAHPRLVVIDGLDECSDQHIQCDLLRIIFRTIPSIPYPLRFLITSRPEPHLTRAFDHDLGQVDRYNLSDDADSSKDIRSFLEGEFREIRRVHPMRAHLSSHWPPQDSICLIVERSSDHFIYASTIMRFIQSIDHRPDDRLHVILGVRQPSGNDRPYSPLDALYRLIFLEIQDPGQLEKIHRALGIIYLRSLKSGLLARCRWTSDSRAIEALLDLRPGDLVLLFNRLLSLVAFDRDDIRIYHKSLFDYLLDSSRSGDFQLDLALTHETVANYILTQQILQNNCSSDEFQDFAYHCQFARLNDPLKGYLRSFALNPEVTFNESRRDDLSSIRSHLLRSTLYLLQAIGRQDLDCTGSCYRNYVKNLNQKLKSAVPLGRRLKIPKLVIRKSEDVTRNLISSLWNSHGEFDPKLNDPHRTPIPATNMSVVNSIEHEHEMLSSYVKVHHQYPDIVFSLLGSNAGLVHSCHFVIQQSTVQNGIYNSPPITPRSIVW